MPRRRHFRSLCALWLAAGLATSALAQQDSSRLREECAAYANAPLPPAASRSAVPTIYPDCASYRAYQGIGQPRNYTKALSCAWEERLAQQAKLTQNSEEPLAWVVGGSLILADLYFNGAGVKRNIPLALRFACEWEEGAAKLAITELKERAAGPFELCDYGVTTFTMNFCGAYASEISDERLARFFNSLKKEMTPQQRDAFDKLLVAHAAYVEAHRKEVDQGGTIRTLRTLGSQEILKDLFRTKITQFEHMRFPKRTAAEIRSADVWLARSYAQALERSRSRPMDEIELGAVTTDGLSSAQSAWLAYRDAWASFAQLRYPNAVDAIRTEVTLERNRLLKTI